MSSNDIFIPKNSDYLLSTNRNHHHRLKQFVQWLDMTGHQWNAVNHATLEKYVVFLEQVKFLAPASIYAHISTIHGRYDELVRESRTLGGIQTEPRPQIWEARKVERPMFLHEPVNYFAPFPRQYKPPTPGVNVVKPPLVDWSALTWRILAQIKQQPEVEHVRLTVEQANKLLSSPNTDTLQGLRDTALIALMLCTGVRETEAHSLNVRNLSQETNAGFPALHVPQKQGCTERLIPYGDMLWARDLVQDWLDAAGISEGPLFRGLYKGDKKVRPGRIGLRSIGMILSNYPIDTDEGPLRVTSFILRRTYARQLYEANVPVTTIQQYLGLTGQEAVLDYIGQISVGKDETLPPSLYSFDKFTP